MKRETFKSFTSIMVAVVLVLGAITTCLAAFAGSSASDADFDGTTASINEQETIIATNINAYEHFRAYVRYRRYGELAYLLNEAAQQGSGDDAQAIQRQGLEIGGLSGELRHNFFPPEYLDNDHSEDESYNVQRELNEAWAEATQIINLDPQPHFDLADSLRRRSLFLTADLIVFALALWFFTGAQILENDLKYLIAFGGILLTLGGLMIMFVVEVLL